MRAPLATCPPAAGAGNPSAEASAALTVTSDSSVSAACATLITAKAMAKHKDVWRKGMGFIGRLRWVGAYVNINENQYQ